MTRKPVTVSVSGPKLTRQTRAAAEAAAMLKTAGRHRDHGRFDEAAAAYRRALTLDPDNVAALNNFGNVLQELGYLDDAVAQFKRLIAIDPERAAAHYNLGNACRRLGRLEDAAASYTRALELDDGISQAHNNLGHVLKRLGRWSKAVESYRRAVAIDPDYAAAYNNLGVALQDMGFLADGTTAFRRALRIDPRLVRAHSNLIQGLCYDPDAGAAEIYAECRRWNEAHEVPLAPRRRPHDNSRDAERRLRVGYVSPDFRGHAVAFFLEPLIAAHDRAAVEVFCYSDVAGGDEFTERLREASDHWRDVEKLSTSQLAERVRADRIDILVDLAGHTARNRLLSFAERPAPVQVSWLGFGASTGLDAMDYRLSDAIAEPDDEAATLTSETPIRLPNGWLCYRPFDRAPDVAPPPVAEAGHVTFGSFNTLAKVSGPALRTWAALLARVPEARLILKSPALADDATRRRYLDLFAAHGVAGPRIDILSWLPDNVAYLDSFRRVDIALDPFPYNGATTTCESLWMGVPVVTLRGESFVGRMGASLLSRVGFDDLIAEDAAAYVEIAAALAGDTTRLATLRADLRGRMAASPLCDEVGFARAVEAAYRDMWRRWCA